MPIVFIHGVNTRREQPGYASTKAAREKLLRTYLAPADATQDAAEGSVVSPYWGDLGVRFAWGGQSVPQPRFHEHGYAGEHAATEADLLVDAQLADLMKGTGGEEHEAATSDRATGGPTLSSLATRDPLALVEALLAPAIADPSLLGLPEDNRLGDEQTATAQGERTALLLATAAETVADPRLIGAIARCVTDDQVLAMLSDALRRAFEESVLSSGTAPGLTPPASLDSGLESRSTPSWVLRLSDQVDEILNRSAARVGRFAWMSYAQRKRGNLHEHASTFLGDVFTYLNTRGDRRDPGPIVGRVLDALLTARADAPDDPLIVVTHSMGGNIFYDIATHFAPELSVDAWISVGGQVGQFEEMKLFLASDPTIVAPAKVQAPSRQIRRWINVYDPADPFGFLAAPIFEGVRDLKFSTGSAMMSAHGAYFLRPSFYKRLVSELDPLLSGSTTERDADT